VELEEVMANIRVAVCAPDPITLAGVSAFLGSASDLTVIPKPRREQVDVVVAVFHRLSSVACTTLRTAAAELCRPIVLVADEIKQAELLTAVECRVVAILPRIAATDHRLVQGIRTAAAGGADIPPNLLGHLVSHAERLHRELLAPNGLGDSSLSPREIDVLRLMADGLDTNEIARDLRYSERTVKNIIYAITNRLHLRNRSHAVAYAMRAGMI
jgi:DNA-binding NarL/FixJ family response regulator